MSEQNTIAGKTVAELIQKYLELRRTKEIKEEQHKKEMEPYAKSMQAIEGVLMEEINRVGGTSIKTQYGTAIRSLWTSFRVADKEAWLAFVFDNDRRDFVTANVSKDAVQEFVDETKTTPPGLQITQLYKLSVRQGETI